MKSSEIINNLLTSEIYAFNIGKAVQVCHGLAKESGWWMCPKTGIDLVEVVNSPKAGIEELLASSIVAQKLCLVHSEVSEAMEGHRKGLMDDKLPHRKMIEVELADTVIRIFDLAGAMNLELGKAVIEKLQFNAQRPDHKPENRIKDGGKGY